MSGPTLHLPDPTLLEFVVRLALFVPLSVMVAASSAVSFDDFVTAIAVSVVSLACIEANFFFTGRSA